MGKIKILHIIKSLGRGGAEMLLPETLKLHDLERFEFHYVYFLPWKDQMVSEIEEKGGMVKCFPASNNLALLKQVNKIQQYINQHQIQIIHSHLPWSGFLARLLHRKISIPLIYTEHNIQERYHFATKFLNKISFNQQSLALGVSKDVTRSIKQFIDPKIPVKTLVNGVNTEKFKFNIEKRKEIRNLYSIPQQAIVVGNVAVFREQKGLLDWLQAFKLLLEKQPDVYGLLVGAGPKEEEIKDTIQKLGLKERVILAGLQKDTISYFSAMDVFMMSSHFEGLPIALLEAMSMQCAVVSTKAGGVTEVVIDNESGLLCEISDTEVMAEKVNFLISDASVLNKYKLAARERVSQKFSLRNMVDSLEKIYLNFNGNKRK